MSRPATKRPKDSKAEGRIRLTFQPDDHEMQVILRAYQATLEQSAAQRPEGRRGQVRRTAGPNFFRQIMVAGFRAMYGPFPTPGGIAGFPAPQPEAAAAPIAPQVVEHKGQHETAPDTQTKVANDRTITDDTAQPHTPTGTGVTPAPALNLSGLLGGGGRVTSGLTTTETP